MILIEFRFSTHIFVFFQTHQVGLVTTTMYSFITVTMRLVIRKHILNLRLKKPAQLQAKANITKSYFYQLSDSTHAKSNRKTMNRNWPNQKPNPALKTVKKIYFESVAPVRYFLYKLKV